MKNSKGFGTINICVQGANLMGTFTDGSIWRASLTWEEIAHFAKTKGKKVPTNLTRQATSIVQKTLQQKL